MKLKYKLIDVSSHNGTIDFKKVKADGIHGVIIRAGYGNNTTDKNFHTNIKNAIANNMHIGVYWFGYAYTNEMAEKEAKYCMSVLSKYAGKIDLPVFYDWEYDSYNYIKKQYGVTATKQLVSDMTSAFCDVIEKNGWFAGFYANIDYLTKFYNDAIKKKYTLWVAQWSSKCTYSGQYAIWQYSETGKVNGVSGNVDTNYLYKDLSSTIKTGGFNGYSKSSTIDTSKYNYDINGDGVVDEKDLELLTAYLKSKCEIE